jgi:hypothetical protein
VVQGCLWSWQGWLGADKSNCVLGSWWKYLCHWDVFRLTLSWKAGELEANGQVCFWQLVGWTSLAAGGVDVFGSWWGGRLWQLVGWTSLAAGGVDVFGSWWGGRLWELMGATLSLGVRWGMYLFKGVDGSSAEDEYLRELVGMTLP